MTDTDLLKTLIHKVAQIEKRMTCKEDLVPVKNGIGETIEQMAFLQEEVETLKTSVELKHIENINSDEVILHSFMEMAHQGPSKV
ncbi:hypothetical protein [Alteribacter natronophilus]|uniref:hypothetical protein n=1 Tax=Alteribacter natronophilus TaxID=2583810 RepID=UPI00110EE5BD|nr:hypothetical protein [Alteribacter natronophilus]TMW72390.1 hypothetical protein FGB90_09305 [Alteribacter natronophilus]